MAGKACSHKHISAAACNYSLEGPNMYSQDDAGCSMNAALQCFHHPVSRVWNMISQANSAVSRHDCLICVWPVLIRSCKIHNKLYNLVHTMVARSSQQTSINMHSAWGKGSDHIQAAMHHSIHVLHSCMHACDAHRFQVCDDITKAGQPLWLGDCLSIDYAENAILIVNVKTCQIVSRIVV